MANYTKRDQRSAELQAYFEKRFGREGPTSFTQSAAWTTVSARRKAFERDGPSTATVGELATLPHCPPWMHATCIGRPNADETWHSCYHHAVVPLDLMARLYGNEMMFERLRELLTCIECGGHKPSMRVSSPGALGQHDPIDIRHVPKWMHRYILPATPPQKSPP